MNAAAVLLALGCAATWGVADFAGGLVSRRVPVMPVIVLSQLGGSLALVVALALHSGGFDWRAAWIGALGGLGGGLGLAAFYKALALGTMSIVSPISACGAVLPFGISIATGERPGTVPLVGAGLALAGAVLASAEERRSAVPDRVRAVVLALAAAAGLGLFTYFLGLGAREGSALSALTGARVGSLGILLVFVASRRQSLRVPGRWLAPIVAIGLADFAANGLFSLASGQGLLALVSVLASLYPVMTVVLAHVGLGERLTRLQIAGVAVALTGVAALSSG